MKATLFSTLLFLPLLVASFSPSVQVITPEAAERARLLAQVEPRLKAIYETNDFGVRSFRATWLPDGSGYLRLERPAGISGGEVARYDARSGQRTVVVPSEKLVPTGKSKPIQLSRFLLSPSGGQYLLYGEVVEGERRGGFWIYDVKSCALRSVDSNPGLWFGDNAFSPDGQQLLGSNGPDLAVFDIASGRVTLLTNDRERTGIDNTSMVSWSPNGKWIAYVQSDESAIPKRAVLVPGDPTYRTFREDRFARIGGPIPVLRVGVVSVEGGSTRWIELADKPGSFYLNQASWAESSDELIVEKLSRFRDVKECLLVNHRTGEIAKPYSETNPAWVDDSSSANAGLVWIQGGKAFVIISEKDGWRRAYVVSRDGSVIKPITAAGSDIIERGKVDDKNGWFYYDASPSNATQRYLYRTRLDGTGKPERLTPRSQSGSHRYAFSPDSKWAFHTYSTFDKPLITDLVQLPEHRSDRVLEDNAGVFEKLKSVIIRPIEFLKLDIGNGVEMDAWMMKPSNFQPTKKYPLIVYVYGEPAAQTVLDDWYGGGQALFHRAMADLGYIVVSIDNRGTPGPKGAAWRRSVFGDLGSLSTEDQASGLKAISKLCPYIDSTRVGVWGWSGGGSNTLNAMFRKPDQYHVGVAVVPKPQAQYYNAWYQEMFMRTPKENPEGYRTASAINYAEGLHGDLLIITGSGETNTHVEITEGLVDRLVAMGKRFDYFVYPNRDHQLSEGKGSVLHVRMLIARYFIDHLPAGPR